MKKLSLFLCLFLTCTVYAENVELLNEEAYKCLYPDLEGKCGTALMNAVKAKIVNHTKLTYDDIRADKAQVDVVDGYVVDMYSSCSFGTKAYCKDVDQDACKCYNREHLLPKSWWGSTGSNDTTSMYTDLFNVIPADYVANTQRSAWIYDEVSGTPSWTNGVSKLGTSTNFYNPGSVFEPSDEYKGDIARAYFYMITCYSDRNFTQGGKGFKYFQTGTATLNSTALDLLLKWHRNDTVSSREKTRNEKVAQVQGNRNPFIDSPELVEYIWGKYKTKAYSCSGVVIADTLTVSCQQARTQALKLSAGEESVDYYKVQGYVTREEEAFSSRYRYQSFKMADSKTGGFVFYAYHCYADSEVGVGDKVEVFGKLKNDNGTPKIERGQTKILSKETALDETSLDWGQCRVFNVMGVEVSNQLETLPKGMYVLYYKGQSKTIIR